MNANNSLLQSKNYKTNSYRKGRIRLSYLIMKCTHLSRGRDELLIIEILHLYLNFK